MAAEPGRDPYREIFAASPVPAFVYDAQTLRILAVSDSVIDRYGYGREKVLAMRFTELSADGDGRRHKLADGRIVEVELTGGDLLYDGRACRVAYCADLTAHNAAVAELAQVREEVVVSERRHRLLFERTPLSVAASDHETFRYVAVSDALVEKYGYSREELLGMTLFDLLVEEHRDEMRAHVTAHPSGTRGPAPGRGLPIKQRLKDGTVIDVEVTSHVIELEGRKCRIAFYNDVTERNRVAAELERAYDRAIEASNMKSAFLANMSHELRTPMNGVIGMNELLLDSGLTYEQRTYAEQVARSGSQMLAIINDILDISKLEAGHVELDETTFDLRQAVRDACAGPRADAVAKSVAFEIDVAPEVPPKVTCDGRRLQQLLLNLVANAVKFTYEGKVSVAVKAPAADADSVLLSISVTDTGIGIEAAALERMFEPFSQADVSTTRIYGGTGLGLAIVRELADLMGALVTAQSEARKGSTFTVTVKVARPSEVRAGAATGAASVAEALPSWREPPLVLVVEDSMVNQIVAARSLERCGCRAQVAGDGREALEALRTRKFDAILMDCQMPVLDGYAATAELRKREASTGGHIPVIAMTAHAMDGDRERCLDAGMDDYISKPMRRDELAAILHRWIPARPTGPDNPMRRRGAARRSRRPAAR